MPFGFRVDVYHHGDPSDRRTLNEINRKVTLLMAKADELLAELEAANNTTNEIAADIDDLKARLGEGGLSPAETAAVQAKLGELSAKLTAVAASHTPGA